MNEEWFGVAALGTPNVDGVFTAIPRIAYEVLSEIWRIDPYANKKVWFNRAIDDLSIDPNQQAH